MSRPVGNVGYTNNSIIDDVSFFEGQTLQNASASNIGNTNTSTAAHRSKSKHVQETGNIVQNEITPVVLGLAKTIKEKKVSPPKHLSEYQQRIE
tara:strand:- start:1052 stop:1333 length:282 start_codon:yes stop_codon:yes gene_type:complete